MPLCLMPTLFKNLAPTLVSLRLVPMPVGPLTFDHETAKTDNFTFAAQEDMNGEIGSDGLINYVIGLDQGTFDDFLAGQTFDHTG
jgi:hypothetical protein